ncbi:MAG TPA: methyltransferase domain-containing protein [Stellaceae bacterium]|nr:methyltransferase domain-containing protein [Stellaceae bacterium]
MTRRSPEPARTGQSWDPDQYQRHGSFVPRFGEAVLERLRPQPGERILDLGCGDGALTAKLAEIATVVGVDSSAEQVAAARARGLDARVMAGEGLDFTAEFEAVFSNAALHWMRQPDAVIAGVARALKPGGRFVGEMGGAGNIAVIAAALDSTLAARGIDAATLWPWYYPTAEEYRGKLERSGLDVVSIVLFPRPTLLPGRLADWIQTFCGPFLAAVPEGERAAFLDEIEVALAPALRDAEGRWTADYVRLRFEAVKR